ncbi:MAG: hypothetical protein ACI4WT_06745 [Oligosphaeraceae bacterium]
MASSSPLSIPILQDGCLPGPETFNQLANAVRRIRSNRPGLTFRLMPDGGLMLEFQQERPYVLNGALCANVLYDDSGTRYWVARGGIVRTPCWEIEIRNDRRTFGASLRSAEFGRAAVAALARASPASRTRRRGRRRYLPRFRAENFQPNRGPITSRPPWLVGRLASLGGIRSRRCRGAGAGFVRFAYTTARTPSVPPALPGGELPAQSLLGGELPAQSLPRGELPAQRTAFSPDGEGAVGTGAISAQGAFAEAHWVLRFSVRR